MGSNCAPKGSVRSASSVREKPTHDKSPMFFFSQRAQMNRTHRVQKDDGPSPFPSPEGKGSDHRDTPIKRM